MPPKVSVHDHIASQSTASLSLLILGVKATIETWLRVHFNLQEVSRKKAEKVLKIIKKGDRNYERFSQWVQKGIKNRKIFAETNNVLVDKSTEFQNRYERMTEIPGEAEAYHVCHNGENKHKAKKHQVKVKGDKDLLYEFILSDDNEVFVLSSLQKQKDHEKIIEGCAALYPNQVMGEFLKKQRNRSSKKFTIEKIKYVTAESIKNQETLEMYDALFKKPAYYKSLSNPIVLKPDVADDRMMKAFNMMHASPLVSPVMRMFHEYAWKRKITEIWIQGGTRLTLVLDTL